MKFKIQLSRETMIFLWVFQYIFFIVHFILQYFFYFTMQFANKIRVKFLLKVYRFTRKIYVDRDKILNKYFFFIFGFENIFLPLLTTI